MKKTRLKDTLDMKPRCVELMQDYEARVITEAFHLEFHSEEFDREQLELRWEDVEFCTVPIYTVRYRGRLLMRRFPDDVIGLRYRYESPIFND